MFIIYHVCNLRYQVIRTKEKRIHCSAKLTKMLPRLCCKNVLELKWFKVQLIKKFGRISSTLAYTVLKLIKNIYEILSS